MTMLTVLLWNKILKYNTILFYLKHVSWFHPSKLCENMVLNAQGFHFRPTFQCWKLNSCITAKQNGIWYNGWENYEIYPHTIIALSQSYGPCWIFTLAVTQVLCNTDPMWRYFNKCLVVCGPLKAIILKLHLVHFGVLLFHVKHVAPL